MNVGRSLVAFCDRKPQHKRFTVDDLFCFHTSQKLMPHLHSYHGVARIKVLVLTYTVGFYGIHYSKL